MTTRPFWLLATLALATGCDPQSVQITPTSIPATPERLISPKAPDEVPPKAEEKAKGDGEGQGQEPGNKAQAPDAEVRLTPLNYDGYRKAVGERPGAKLVVVDAWATWCPPCMENFPHLVEMHRKYADRGLACISLSLDAPDVPKSVAAANAFLNDKKATFLNVLLDEDQGDAFDKLDINGVPAVLIYDPSGKELRRFVGDDPNRPFTYEQVEQVVVKLLNGETLADDAPGEVHKPRDSK